MLRRFDLNTLFSSVVGALYLLIPYGLTEILLTQPIFLRADWFRGGLILTVVSFALLLVSATVASVRGTLSKNQKFLEGSLVAFILTGFAASFVAGLWGGTVTAVFGDEIIKLHSFGSIAAAMGVMGVMWAGFIALYSGEEKQE